MNIDKPSSKKRIVMFSNAWFDGFIEKTISSYKIKKNLVDDKSAYKDSQNEYLNKIIEQKEARITELLSEIERYKKIIE